MTNIMLDLESMGVSSNAAIIAIGAVEFDDIRGIGEEFYTTVDLQSCIDKGLQVDGSTIIWWMKQSEAARKEFFRKGSSLKGALLAFQGWLNKLETNNIQMWGNGAAFDNVILGNAYKSYKVKQPWPFWGDRCFRTLKASFPDIPKFPAVGVAHNALEDAKWQANYLIELVNQNKLTHVL